MSANQKQAPSAAPQQQRYAQGPYAPRATTPQRPDGFHVTTPPAGFVPQTSQQGASQGPTIRTMAQSGGGPPTQSSTPPQNAELKQMQQQPGQLPPITYVQQPVRTGGQPTAAGFYRTQPPPPTQQGGPRMSNHHRQTMAAASTHATHATPAPMYSPHQMPLFQASMSQPITYQMQMPYNAPRPPSYFAASQPFTMLPGQYIQGPYPTQQPQQQYFFQNTTSMTMASRQGPPPPVASAPQSGAQQPQQNIGPLQGQPMPPHAAPKKKPRAKAIPIINPNSGKEIFDEEDSQPPSGESSARDTPQPPAATSMQQLISADFAARVAIVASEDKEQQQQHQQQATGQSQQQQQQQQPSAVDVDVQQMQQPMGMGAMSYGSSVQQQQQQQTHHNAAAKENDIHHKTIDTSLAQNSKLQASTKEFIPEITKHAPHPPKETTPVVSANTDGVEVTLPPKPRERESPAKTRRQQQHHHHHHHQPPQQQQQHQLPQVPPQLQLQQPPPPQLPQPAPLPPRGESAPKEQPPAPSEPPAPIIIPQGKELQTGSAPDVAQPHEAPEVKMGPKVATPAIAKIKPAVEAVGKNSLQAATQNSTSVVEESSAIGNAKNKGGGQKVKENPSGGALQQSKPSMPVPGSQPPKPSSKANKMRELNMKGASKEGTDMDVFNTGPEALHAPNTPHGENCNNTGPPKEEIIIENNPVPQQLQQQQQQMPSPAPQKLADGKPMLPKPLVDVTSIVKEEPVRPLKPHPQQIQQIQPPATTDAQDETDRAVSEKLVQVKNEANNLKMNSSENSDTPVIDKTIRYKKDQWSPLNQDGKKCYDRDFLLCLQNNPKCKKKPENLPDLDVVLKDNNRSRMDARPFSLNRQTEVLMPAFHKSSSQRGPLPKRNSQQGKAGLKSGKPQNTIHVSLSLREDVKLHESENAWRPARLGTAATFTDDELRTAELYKKVRGVLNKLTPEKFEKLLNQVRALSIDNAERLQGVIDLVFEKAVDEPNFSVAYALMCKELALMQVPSNSKNKDEPEFVNFRKLLITRCQLEFEKNSVDENARNLKLKEIEECTDPEKKKELQLLLEEDDRRMRIKSVGNIRFIGELFKQQMLTVKIMLRCINILLDSKDEDSLECLCKLLTTIGKDLEIAKNQNLNSYFTTMQEIVDKKHGKISSRVRFMLQDVIDLRSSKWVPRRQDLNPKTMEQIQKEADTEQLNIQVMNSGPMNTPRKEDRLGGGGGAPGSSSDRKRRNNQPDDGGWSMATSRNRNTYMVESSKLMNKPPPIDDMTLGSKNLFGQWGRGSNIKTQAQTPVTNTANMYAALENIGSEQEKGRSAYESRLTKDPYVSKGHSMERSGYKQPYEDGRGSRSGSQHRAAPPAPQPQKPPAAPVPAPPMPAKPLLSPELLKLRMNNIMEEYLNDCCSLKECESDIRASIDPSKLPEFIFEGYNSVLERSTTTRRKAGKLFAALVKSELVSAEDLGKALRDVLGQADDLVIDIPKLWDYLAEMIHPLVADGVMPLEKLVPCLDVLVVQGHAHKLMAQLLKLMVAESGPNYVVDMWQSSGVRFANFVAADAVESYVTEHKFDFLLGGAGTPVVNQGTLSWDQVHSKLLNFLKTNTPFDTITDWISANVGKRIEENQFIRTLVTAVIENSVITSNNVIKLREDFLKNRYMLLQRYIDNKGSRELQCLFALQALVHKWEHPQGLLLSILERMWDGGLLSNDSIFAWEKCKDSTEHEGKGVALKSLQGLLTAVKEADDDDEIASSASEEA